VDPRGAISAAGRRRVEAELARTGLLLVQGQAEIPSVADLLAEAPVTTRGYSWDYAPAWNLTDEYEVAANDVAVVKLFRGRRTLVHERHWNAVDALARAAHARISAGDQGAAAAAFLLAVDEQPGVPLGVLRGDLGLARRDFDRTKRDLEQWCCMFGRERDDVEHHTHEPALYPWAQHRIATARRPGRGRARDADRAAEDLRAAVPGSKPGIRTAQLFPVVRAALG
jgi:hypothetical protein